MRNVVRHSGLGLIPGLFLLVLAVPAIAKSNQAWLGVTTQQVTEELRDALDLRGDGVLVNRVVIDGPADRAGIRKGDVIISVNTRSVESPSELADAVQALAIGASASVRVMRRGGAQTISVKLGERPETLDEDTFDVPTPSPSWNDGSGERRIRAFKDGKEVDPEDLDFNFDYDGKDGMEGLKGLRHLRGNSSPGGMFWGRPRLGVRLEKMNPDLAGYFGGTNGRGALVVEVIEDTPAEKAGIKAGDVITAVGTTTVEDASDLSKAIAGDERTVSLTVVRKGVRRTIEADLGESPRNSMTWRMRDGRAPRAPRAPMAPRAPGMTSPDAEEGDAELRREMKELRQQLDELKKQLGERDR